MKCPNCGAENPDGLSFCSICGNPLPAQSRPNPLEQEQAPVQEPQFNQTPVQEPQFNQAPNQYQQPVYQQPVYQQPAYQQPVEPEKLITPWGYLGYSLLFSIPLVGIILIIVFSFGGSSTKNLKNFARYQLISIVIVAIIYVIFIAIFGAALTSKMSSGKYY